MSDGVWVGNPQVGLWLIGDNGAVGAINPTYNNSREPIYYTVDIWGVEGLAVMQFPTELDAKNFVESTCELIDG